MRNNNQEMKRVEYKNIVNQNFAVVKQVHEVPYEPICFALKFYLINNLCYYNYINYIKIKYFGGVYEMKRPKNKRERAITLIALIITIIILLILSGVAIFALFGKNGIIARTKEAAKQNAIAAKKEEVQMAIQNELIDNQGDKSKVKLSSVVDTVKKNYSDKKKDAIIGETTGATPDGFPGKITYNKPASGISESIIIEIDENLNVTGSTGIRWF